MLPGNLYITNYCDARCAPFQNFARLPVSDAHALAKTLSVNATASFTSFSRFCDRDFEGYYGKRLRTEKWLHESFLALGGKPRNAHPLYFVLNESSYLSNNWYEKCIITRLLLSDINSVDVSFTFGDSMSKMDAPDRMDPFTKESLFTFIKERNPDVLMFLEELNRQNKYIEAQLWNDEYIKNP